MGSLLLALLALLALAAAVNVAVWIALLAAWIGQRREGPVGLRGGPPGRDLDQGKG